MKIRQGFVSNSSSSSFIVNTRTHEELGEVMSPSAPSLAFATVVSSDWLNKFSNNPSSALKGIMGCHIDEENIVSDSIWAIDDKLITIGEKELRVVAMGVSEYRCFLVGIHARKDATEEDAKNFFLEVFGELPEDPIDKFKYGQVER